VRRAAVPFLALALTRTASAEPRGDTIAVLVHASERSTWRKVADAFTRGSGAAVDVVEGPNATDLRENLYTTSLLAEDDTFDLVYMDVTWTPKLAAKGWLLPLDGDIPASELAALAPAALESGRFGGRLFRVPVKTDAGLLYYRKDLIERAGLPPPKTFEELARAARAVASPPEVWGFLFQGSQYEGLVCVYLEALRGHGGFWIDPATLAVGLDRPEARAALDFLVRCRRDGLSPPGVTTLKEDESRRLFQDGHAVFLRNWSYTWRLAQRPDSRVAGKVGVTSVPSATGLFGAGTLGGWGLGVSRFARHPRTAAAFIRFAISPEGQRLLCAEAGFAPARLSSYEDPVLVAANPVLPDLKRLLSGAVPRPIVPEYALASDILQRHLSAALSGLTSSGAALEAAAKETRFILGSKGRPSRASSSARLWGDGRWYRALVNTCVFTGASVAIETLLGLAFALVLHARLRAQGALRAAVLVPWALPTAVMALAWAWIFNDTFGVANDVLVRLHLVAHPIAWLGEPRFAMAAIVAADVWKTTPFVALVVLAGLQAIPEDVLEAARVDGASPPRRFLRVTLPLLAPSLAVAVLFRAVQAWGAFDVVYVMTGGGPGGATETVSLYAYQSYFRYLDFRYGVTIALQSMLLMAAVAGAGLVAARRGETA
jgi:multiple sugar transport system substrate-binding protein